MQILYFSVIDVVFGIRILSCYIFYLFLSISIDKVSWNLYSQYNAKSFLPKHLRSMKHIYYVTPRVTISKNMKDLTSWELAYPLSEELVSRWVSFSQGWDILGLWRVCAGCPCHLFVQGGRSDECHHFQWVLGERLLSQRWHKALGCHACCFHARNFGKTWSMQKGGLSE